MRKPTKPKSKRMNLQEQLAAERIRRHRAESALAGLAEEIADLKKANAGLRHTGTSSLTPGRFAFGHLRDHNGETLSEMERHALHGAARGWPYPGNADPVYAREVRP